MQARLITEIGTRAWLRVYWDVYDGDKAGNTCPNSLGLGSAGYHNGMIHLADSSQLEEWTLGGDGKDYPLARYPSKCDHCGAVAPPPVATLGVGTRTVTYHILRKRLYSSITGQPEPGDLFWETWQHKPERIWCEWDNCDGRHLVAILPNGHQWNIDGRASNCTMKDERTHRCWVRHGEPPAIHVDKSGHTCGAGGGSIDAHGWHGHLHNGVFVRC